MKLNFKNNQAFSLIELMIGALIVSLLSGILVIVVTNSGAKTQIDLNTVKTFDLTVKNKLAQNLVGEWPFDEGSGSIANNYSDYGSELNGTIYGGATYQSSANCISGTCLSFDGSNDYVDVGNSSNWKFGTGDFTVSFWMKPAVWQHGSGEPTEYMTLMGNGNYSTNWDGFHFGRVGSWWATNLGIPEGGIMFLLGNGTSNDAVGTTKALSIGTWYYVVGTRSNGSTSIYLDGVLQQNKSIAYNVTVNRALTIGKQNDATYGRYFNGLIDEVRIYNATYNLSQIQQQYRIGLAELLINGEINQNEYNQRIADLQKKVAAK